MDTPMVEIKIEVARLCERVEGLTKAVNESLERGSEKLNDHEKRLRTVERRQHWFLGIGAGVAAIVSGAWQWLRDGL